MDSSFVQKMPKLGFGLMRLPQINGKIDITQTCEMVDMFLLKGFKYFDTAYAYGDGESECAIKKALVERYPRENFYLATKLPSSSNIKAAEEAKKMFDVSLERTGAGYFDFYLLHNLGEQRTAFFDKFNLWEFIQQKKEEGLIKYIGFSFHDKAEELGRLLTAHPEIDFVQLQINYVDWENPFVESRKCYEMARKHGKPIVIMEPVKGGNLSQLPEEVQMLFESIRPGASPSSWAIRFAASLEGVLTVLSGMSNIAQMEDNLETMEDFNPMEEREYAAIEEARKAYNALPVIFCTACGYCMKDCPQHIAIPGSFAAYNTFVRFSVRHLAKGNYEWNTVGHGCAKASACIECGKCEMICPQHIPIREALKKVVVAFET